MTSKEIKEFIDELGERHIADVKSICKKMDEALEDELKYQASLHDIPLSQAPNRLIVIERVNNCMEKSIAVDGVIKSTISAKLSAQSATLDITISRNQ